MTSTTSSLDCNPQSQGFPVVNTTPEGSRPATGWERKLDPRTVHPLPILPATHVWGIDYSVVSMEGALEFIDTMIRRREPSYAITANLNYAMLCHQNPRLASFTQHCRLVLCDGMPIFWRSLLNKTKLPERVAGADLIYRLAERSAVRGYRIFFMGGEPGVAQAAADRLHELYPRLTIAGVESPPFRPLSPSEHEALCQRIRDAKPDILLVAFGQPKGEFWIEENYRSLGVPLSIQLGASFDFIVGKARRAPQWMQRIGMEWFYRMLCDPRRLVLRYARNAWYLSSVLRQELLDATR